MVARDCKPGSPPDGTVCADRRSCDHLGPAAAWAAEEAHRRRAGVPGRGAGAARCPVGASLAADVLRPARAPVPLPAEPARLSQAAQGGRAAAGPVPPAGGGLPGAAPAARGGPPRHGAIGWIRQWIESVNDTLKGQLDLERHGGRTTEGVYARITQRLLAMATAIWHNWTTAEPGKRSLTAYDP